MATLSSISKFLACYGQKGRGAGAGGQVPQPGTIVVFLTILIWNGVNSQSKSNKLQYENKNRYDETEHHGGNIDPQK